MSAVQVLAIAPDAQARAARTERARTELAAAIDLVAGGRYPQVILANLADARLVAADLQTMADEYGVRLELIGHLADFGSDLVVTRR